MTPHDFQDDGHPDDAIDDGDVPIVLDDRVHELQARMDAVTDKASALAFYADLAGGDR